MTCLVGYRNWLNKFRSKGFEYRHRLKILFSAMIPNSVTEFVLVITKTPTTMATTMATTITKTASTSYHIVIATAITVTVSTTEIA